MAAQSAGSSDDTVPPEMNLQSDFVSMYFVVFFLLHIIRREKKRDGADSMRCLHLLTTMIEDCLDADRCHDWNPYSVLLNGHFSKDGDSYFRCKGLVSNKHAKSVLEDLGLPYPYNLDGGFNDRRMALDAKIMYKFLARDGALPFEVICATAALLEDALQCGACMFRYEETVRGQDDYRKKVSVLDKGVAAGRLIGAPQQGIKAACAPPVRQSSVPLLTTKANEDEEKVGAGAQGSVEMELCSQLCVHAGATKTPMLYKNVVEQYSLLL